MKYLVRLMDESDCKLVVNADSEEAAIHTAAAKLMLPTRMLIAVESPVYQAPQLKPPTKGTDEVTPEQQQ